MRSPVFVDPFVLACPSAEDGLTQFQEYVENLIEWVDLRNAGWIDLYVSRDAVKVLADADAYPPYQELDRTIKVLGIASIQCKDVIELINGILVKSRTIEDALCIDDLLFENYSVVPTISQFPRNDKFQYHIQLLTILIALQNQFVNSKVKQILITKKDSSYTGITTVRAEISEMLYERTVIPNEIKIPFSIEGHFYLCRCLHSFHLYLDPCSTWANAICERGLKKAMELYSYQNPPQPGPYINVLEDRNYTFGKGFIDSCKPHGFLNDFTKIQMLLRCCCEVIFGTNLRATHILRKSSGGGSAQLKRGNDAAWRRDIDHEYHLHYWTTINGYELAKVVNHNDFSIE
jgi:hypothetical protein